MDQATNGSGDDAPSVADAYYRLTASAALAEIRSGRLTVEAYARSLLQRIDSRDAKVAAWAHLESQQVLCQARDLDRVPPGERGPLHGVPVAIKDVVFTKDMPTQQGSASYQDHFPHVDAALVVVLRHAGALILGKTVTTEFAATTTQVPTLNPHHPAHTPGGSSSGSAAAVADFQAPLAIGTQTGGSIVRPASFCGVYGFKPTWNAVSREGVKLSSPTLDTVGFFARCVDDLDLLCDVFNLEDDDDDNHDNTINDNNSSNNYNNNSSNDSHNGNLENNDDDDASPAAKSAVFSGIQGARFAICETPAWPAAGPGTRAALARAASLLRSHGAVVETVDLSPSFHQVPHFHNVILHAEARPVFLSEHLRQGDRLAPELREFAKGEKGYTRAELVAALDEVSAKRRLMDELASRYTAIVTPSAMDEAPEGVRGTGSPVFNRMWTVLHSPVVNVPGFRGSTGLPIGISLVSGRYRDRHLLRVAREIGRIFEAEGGWRSAL